MPTVEEGLRQRTRRPIDTQYETAAQAALESLLQHVPQDVPARMELAQVTLRQALFRASGNQLLQAAAVPSGDALLDIQLVQRLCFTPSSMQMREPIHTRGLGTWQPYAHHLEPLWRWLGRSA